MSYLDVEIARIEKYIAGLGIKLIKSSTNAFEHGSWSPNEIHIFKNRMKAKTTIILTLLHEVCHQIHYMGNDKPPIPDEILLPIEQLTRPQRKKILDYERPGIELMPSIAIELNLKIPLWKVYMQSQLDLWQYEFFYENGFYPKRKDENLKRKELMKLYKGKNK